MSNPKRSKWSVLLIVVLLVGAMGALTWFMPANGSQAAVGGPGPLAFISPIGEPQLSLNKGVDTAAPAPGSLINYTLSYSNPNPGSQAFAVRLYDFLPAGVQYISSTLPATQLPNGLLLFTVPSVGPGTEDHNITVRVQVLESLEGYEQLTNHALISADGATPATASVKMTVSPRWGELLLEKTGPAAALINRQIVYVLTCRNPLTSTVTLKGVTLADVLPAGVTFVSASPAPDVMTEPLVQWALGDLAPGESRSVAVTAMAPPNFTRVTNTALASGRQLTMTAALFSTQIVTQGQILNVSKVASASQVDVGDTLVYTLSYSNVGNQATTNVVLTDTLPAGITVIAANPPWSTTTAQARTWQLGMLDVGESGQIVMTTTVNGPWNRTLTNLADITGATGSFPDHAKLETAVRSAQLYLPVVWIFY